MERLSRLSRSVVGRRALVTGAASGIGRAITELFLDESMAVAAVDRNAEGLDELVSRAASVGAAERLHAIVGDLADPLEPDRVVVLALEALGGLDVLVNNAGVVLPSGVAHPSEQFDELWLRTFEVNVNAAARLVRASSEALIASGQGRIVNIASSEAVVATPGLAAYSASKAGLAGLTRSLAVELGPYGVTANCICPGPIDTAMTAGITAPARERYAGRHVALRRYGLPEEVAHMVLNCCLPSSSFVTGATILVDGGLTVRHT